jgi:hypothetical protein
MSYDVILIKILNQKQMNSLKKQGGRQCYQISWEIIIDEN